MSRFWEIVFCLPLLFRRHVCLYKLKQSPSCELPLTARKTVLSHLKEMYESSPHVRECGFRNPGLWTGIQLKESGMLLRIGIQNTSPTDKDWNQVPWIRNLPAWNPESKTVLDSLAWGVRRAWTGYQAKLVCSTVSSGMHCLLCCARWYWLLNL